MIRRNLAFYIFGLVEIIQERNTFCDFIRSVKPKIWLSYLGYGAVTGVLIAGIYNMLVVKGLNLFGLESAIE